MYSRDVGDNLKTLNIQVKLIYRYPIIILSILSSWACSVKNTTTCKDCYAIVNINIIDVELGKVDSNMSLIIQDNYILKIGKSSDFKIPTNATKIDGNEKFLIPGLWDMHAHTVTDSMTRQITFPLLISNGITGIREMISDCYDEEYSCEKTIYVSKKWRKDIATGDLIGPRLVLGSQRVNGQRGDSSTILSPGTPEHGRAHVIFLKQRGVDFIKIYEELPRDVFFAVAEEANRQNVVFAGHVPFEVKASEVAISGQKSIEHCCDENFMLECSQIENELRQKWLKALEDETFNMGALILEMAATYDSTKCDRVFDILKEHGTWFVPTLIVSESHYPFYSDWTKDERLKYLPESEKLWWKQAMEDYYFVFGEWDKDKQLQMRERRFEIVSTIHNKDIPILSGTDCASIGVFWGSSIHEELELLVQAGLSEFEALKTATINPVLFLEATDSLGSISKGKIADLVILDDNPLKDITNTQKISGVITNGRYFNRAELDSLLLSVETNVKNNFK